MHSEKSDVVIVGAGVIGCGIAYQLAREGAKVTVIERSAIGAESSGAAAGILAPRLHATNPAILPLALWSESRFPTLVDGLQEESGLRLEYANCGALELAYDERSEERLREKIAFMTAAGQRADWLDAHETLHREPAVDPALRGALHDPGANQIHPLRFTQALAQAAARRGVHFQIGVEARSIERNGDRAAAVQTDSGAIQADHVVIAAGAWAGHWSETLGLPIPVVPARGQILTLSSVPTPVRSIVYGKGVYLLPRTDGTVVLGATYERVGFDRSLTPEGLGWLLVTGTQLCPALGQSRFEQAWTGLRPASGDDLPIVGRVPTWENVIVATGHYRDGIVLAPATAMAVTDLILRGESDLPIAPLHPARFTGIEVPRA
ncbi:MAG: glycine oxidase ThiO [Chloroflexi bacterium]|nr:glycine oxidase ThiO [Chloroflexota bacterium]